MNYNEAVAGHLKKIYAKNSDLENQNNKISIIKNIYQELDEIYLPQYHKKIKSEKFKTLYDFADYEEMGGLLYLRQENMYVSDIIQLSFKSYYPNIIVHMASHGLIDKISDMYCYLVQNREDINSYLSDEERKLFNILINYKFGILWKEYPSSGFKITSFSRFLLNEIIKMDKLNDIVYIDTDTIYCYNNINFINKIENFLDDMFDFEIIEPKRFLFIAKKKYVEFENKLGIAKIKGYAISPLYKNKNILNMAYSMYGGELSFIDFFKSRKNFSNLFTQAKIKLDRNKKLNRILNI